MIDQFTKEDFELWLENHKPFESQGIIDGEYCYHIILDGQASIMVRSSIGKNGVAAGSGKDSIRLWLVGNDGEPLSNKIDRHTKRIKDWQKRLNEKIYKLAKRRANAGDCHNCFKPFSIYQNTKTDELFVKCRPCSKKLNKRMMGNLNNEGWFAEESQMSTPNSVSLPQPKSNTPSCPNCNSKMILKSGSYYDDFWGCSTFPKCKGTISMTKKKVVLKTFAPSAYQTAIYDFVENGSGHGIIYGVAGCGKTATAVSSLELLPPTAKAKYAAFNKHIERDIRSKAPDHISVSTFHTWGKANILNKYPLAVINQWKVHGIIDDLAPKIQGDLKYDVVKAVSLLKGNMRQPIESEIMEIADAFDLDIVENDTDLIATAFTKSIKDMKTIDFDDMVYYPAVGIVPCEKFDNIIVDEAQDMNSAQYILSKKSLALLGRFMGIGDPNQSIYAFRGAHIGIMDFIARELDATRLPLSISYRAPLAIVDLVNREYSHIQFEAAENAKNGYVGEIDYGSFLGKVDQNSAVLCRTNAPLIGPCFELIRRGIKATILGKDIGDGLVRLIEKRERLKRVSSLNELLRQIVVYCDNKIDKAFKKKRLSKVALFQDQKATITALAVGCDTIQKLKQKTSSVFSKDQSGVTFSTIHKAKGLEWQKVFVVGPLGNHPMGDAGQETNIRYVRDTRTLDQLYYVRG